MAQPERRAMNYNQVGDSDLTVSEITLGTMTFGQQNTEKEAHEILSYAFENGINTLDTAEVYPIPMKKETQGLTDKYIGNWLKSQSRHQIILATKVSGYSERSSYIRDNAEVVRVDAANIKESVEKSLKRLNTDYIDLLQIHWPDRYVALFGEFFYDPSKWRQSVPFLEQLRAFDELIHEGKVRYIGVSNETSYGVMEFINAAKTEGLPKIVSIQNSYSLLVRCKFEVDLVEVCHPNNCNVGLLCYSPLAGGVLSGKYLDSESEAAKRGRLQLFPGYMERYNKSIAKEATALYIEVAKKHGLSPVELALGFVRDRPFMTSTIIGATSVEQLKEDIDAFLTTDRPLTPDYRKGGFKKYCDLISCLLVAEQNNELLMKNHELRPTGSAPLSEANMVAHNQSGGRDRDRGSDRGRGRGRGRDRGRGQGCGFENMDRATQLIIDDEDICLVDSATTHTILKKEKYFSCLNLQLSNVNSIYSRAKLIKGYEKAHILLPGDSPIKTIRLDNAGEFTSQTFKEYCMSIGISVEHSVAHVHTQNGLTESLIKRIQMIARPMIMKAKLLVSAWGHAVLHAATLIRIRPTSHHTYSPLQLVFGQEPNNSHLRIFGCAVYVSIALPQCIKTGPQRRMGIYVGYDSPSIIRGDKKQLGSERGRPISSKDRNPRKKKGAHYQNGQVEVKDTLEGSSIRTLDMTVQEEPRVPKNEEISINYVMSRKIWNQNEIYVDDDFAYNVALEVMENDEDHEPKSVSECIKRNDWPKWKDAIEAELKSLEKRKVFGHVVRTSKGVKPV
nr:protein NADP(H)-dependent aldo-keto reductase [Tanacetum cinerariifolium]